MGDMCWVFCTLLSVFLTSSESRSARSYIEGQPYTYLSYADILHNLKEFQSKLPGLFKLSDAQSTFPTLSSVGTCTEYLEQNSENDTPTPCRQYYVTVTNHATWAADLARPQIIISGTLHGDERVGPHASIALLQLLADNYGTDPWLTYLVDHRVLVVVPTTNAIGFHLDRREEIQNYAIHFDPNRDFPFDQNPEKCMLTMAGRVINELFRSHIFQLMLTFHGGTNVLGYEWGDWNHCDRNGKVTT